MKKVVNKILKLLKKLKNSQFTILSCAKVSTFLKVFTEMKEVKLLLNFFQPYTSLLLEKGSFTNQIKILIQSHI